MPKIYYCKHCQQFLEKKGYFFESRTEPTNHCPLCKNEYKIFNVKYSNWVKIGIPISIFIGLLFFTFNFLDIYYRGWDVMGLVCFSGLFIIIGISIMIIIIYYLSKYYLKIMINKLKKEYPELKVGKTLFKRKSTILNPNKEFWDVTIYPNGIKVYCHQTDKDGYLKREGGKIELLPKNEIKKIYRYNYLNRNLKKPTGFHLETNDNKICFIKLGFMAKNYKTILKALKACFEEEWKKIFNSKILIDKEALHLQI